jgi:hypothetical protein
MWKGSATSSMIHDPVCTLLCMSTRGKGKMGLDITYDQGSVHNVMRHLVRERDNRTLGGFPTRHSTAAHSQELTNLFELITIVLYIYFICSILVKLGDFER